MLSTSEKQQGGHRGEPEWNDKGGNGKRVRDDVIKAVGKERSQKVLLSMVRSLTLIPSDSIRGFGMEE